MADSSSGASTQSSRPAKEEAGGPSFEDRIAALADGRRCRALACAVEAEDPLSLDELVDEIVGAGGGTTPLASDPDHVALRLHHVHLPKLDDVGFVDYDERRQYVEVTDAGERFRPLLEEL